MTRLCLAILLVLASCSYPHKDYGEFAQCVHGSVSAHVVQTTTNETAGDPPNPQTSEYDAQGYISQNGPALSYFQFVGLADEHRFSVDQITEDDSWFTVLGLWVDYATVGVIETSGAANLTTTATIHYWDSTGHLEVGGVYRFDYEIWAAKPYGHTEGG